ncbi:MAG TPA: MarR family transcriptional regulator [Candidatus Intestinimonas stercoravium]|uniref:MarR family winged helix-turn-helix transcriptional regulator n=1 Tax=uncultured Intestinimonas sp. TaxID=1689265 RepID=UPI001F9B675A|nr:MarR family transcriptional regulator [uncultured Intestinimonas sp.]HJA62796.1 MarR family transcriptional regulator [Candidatus Intestinimonas stercoravium]
MLDQVFNEVYTKFKLHFYKAVFGRFQTREASLTTVETFCMEIIMALDAPTVNEFSSFLGISAPNAAYKINNLIQKGYVRKEQSESDKREYHLVVTQKYIDYYNISYRYVSKVVERVKERFPPEDVAKMEEMLRVISDELMPELPLQAQTDVAEAEK